MAVTPRESNQPRADTADQREQRPHGKAKAQPMRDHDQAGGYGQ